MCLLIPPLQTELLPHRNVTYGYNIPCFSPHNLAGLRTRTCLHTHRKLSAHRELRGHYLDKHADLTQASSVARMAPSPVST